VQWSDTFEESDQDQFALQDKLVNAIASALKVTLSPETKSKVEARGTRSAEALDLVQRANFQTDLFTAASLRQAVSLAELAIQKDSTYAEAWAALANAWGTLADDFVSPREAVPKLRGPVQRALELNPQSADAHAQLGTQLLFYDYDLEGAKREFTTALALDSSNVSAATWYMAILDMYPALADSTLAVAERGLRLNPGSIAMVSYASTLRANKKLPDATRRARCATFEKMTGNSAKCDVFRLLDKGDTTGALALLRAQNQAHADDMATASGGSNAGFAQVLAHIGDKTNARKYLNMAIAKSAREYVREDVIAITYFRLGDIDQSIAWWARSVESNGAQVIWLATDPDFAPLRKDPRVKALLAKAGVKYIAP